MGKGGKGGKGRQWEDGMSLQPWHLLFLVRSYILIHIIIYMVYMVYIFIVVIGRHTSSVKFYENVSEGIVREVRAWAWECQQCQAKEEGRHVKEGGHND